MKESQALVTGLSEEKGRTIRGFSLIVLLFALMLTLLLEALDQTIVGTALPKIIASLQGFENYTWVATAYLLASTVIIPIAGKLSDQFGRKWFFVTGVIIFLFGSLLSGTSQNINQLILFRSIQGLGAGIGISLVFTAIGDIFPAAERSRWQGIFAGVYGLSSVVGPTLGGWLTDHGPLVGNIVTDNTRWRWIFYINLPLGILALLALLIFYPRISNGEVARQSIQPNLRQIDFPGALLSAGATVCLLLGLTWGGNQVYSWISPQVIGTLVAAVILYILFFVVERFVAEPILPLHFLRNQLFAADAVLSLTVGMVLLSLIIYLPLYLQGVLGESATNSGEVITPLTISVTLGSALVGLLIAKLGHYHWLAVLGGIFACIGSFLFTQMGATTNLAVAWIGMVIVGFGIGMFFPMLNLVVQNGLPRRFMGASTAAITYVRALGQTLGLAIVGTVVNHTITTALRLPASANQLSGLARQYSTNPEVLVDSTFRNVVVNTAVFFEKRTASTLANSTVPPGPHHNQIVAQMVQQAAQRELVILNQVFAALKQALTVAITGGFWLIFLFCCIAFLAALFLKDVPLSKEFVDEAGVTGEPEESSNASYNSEGRM